MATLKISDLSVGDWVEFKGELCKVLDCGTTIVTPRTLEFKPRLTLSAKYDIYDCVDVDKVNPIPITAEILEKNGFEEICGMRYNSDTLMEFEQYEDGWCRTINCGEYSVYFIKYVHQFQHALRLAGIDKDINL